MEKTTTTAAEESKSLPHLERVRQVLAGNRLVPRSDLIGAGINPAAISRAVSEGIAISYARGVYVAPDADLPEGVSFAATTLLNPGGVVCLLSAALYHRLSDENPEDVWYAVDAKKIHQISNTTKSRDPVKLVYWSEEARSIGVDTLRIAGVDVRMTSAARTVVDMLRYRNKLGDEPAMKTLRDFAAGGGDLKEVLRLARELDWLKSIEAAVCAAEELQPLLPRSGP